MYNKSPNVIELRDKMKEFKQALKLSYPVLGYNRPQHVYCSNNDLHARSIIHKVQEELYMTTTQQFFTILIMALGVVIKRTLPFIVFPTEEKTPQFVRFLGKFLASAVFGMLVVYCLKDIQFQEGNHGVLRIMGVVCCILLHLWRKNMSLTIAGGTIFYMLLIQNI